MATCTFTPPPGAHSVAASFSGTSNFQPSSATADLWSHAPGQTGPPVCAPPAQGQPSQPDICLTDPNVSHLVNDQIPFGVGTPSAVNTDGQGTDSLLTYTGDGVQSYAPDGNGAFNDGESEFDDESASIPPGICGSGDSDCAGYGVAQATVGAHLPWIGTYLSSEYGFTVLQEDPSAPGYFQPDPQGDFLTSEGLGTSNAASDGTFRADPLASAGYSDFTLADVHGCPALFALQADNPGIQIYQQGHGSDGQCDGNFDIAPSFSSTEDRGVPDHGCRPNRARDGQLPRRQRRDRRGHHVLAVLGRVPGQRGGLDQPGQR